MAFIERGRLPLNMTNSIVVSLATPRNNADEVRAAIYVFWIGHNEDGTPFERPSKRGFMLTSEQMKQLAAMLLETAEEIDTMDVKKFIKDNTVAPERVERF
jgi:hypothetical protein